jgi:hypothetical protein
MSHPGITTGIASPFFLSASYPDPPQVGQPTFAPSPVFNFKSNLLPFQFQMEAASYIMTGLLLSIQIQIWP